MTNSDNNNKHNSKDDTASTRPVHLPMLTLIHDWADADGYQGVQPHLLTPTTTTTTTQGGMMMMMMICGQCFTASYPHNAAPLLSGQFTTTTPPMCV